MLERPLIIFLFWTLACVAASGQESAALHDPMMPYSRTDSGAEPAPSYHLRGTLISPSGRVAMFNGKLAHEGDRVNGAQILSIDPGAVRIRTNSGELTVYMGSRGARVSPEPARRQAAPEADTATGAVSSEVLANVPAGTNARHGPVRDGETLSEIAQRYRNEFSMNQMIVALFQANPHAFSGNINLLREGAVLRIPDSHELDRLGHETATAEVARQHIDWRNDDPRLVRQAEVPDQRSYGPIGRGETLSGIAERIVPDGVTRNQMMIALFQANPHAFSDNINILYAGAVLRLPYGDEMSSQPREIARAEVVRQTDAWRGGLLQQARMTSEPDRGGSSPGSYDDSQLRLAEADARSPPGWWPDEM